VELDRVRAARLGMTQQNVAQAMLIGLSGALLASPSFWSIRRTT